MFGGKKKKILSEGVQAQAVVLNVRDTGVTINNNPRVKLTLQVRPDGQAPFEAEKAVTVSRVSIPRAGDGFIVRYDPSDPSRIEFDGEAVAAVNADAEASQAQAVANQLPADLAANGIVGRGGLVDVQVAPGGGQLVNCQLTIGVRLIDGTPMYRATCGLSVTQETAQKLIPQQTILTVRADPQNHQRIAVSLGEPTPSVIVDDPRVVDPPTRALAEGVPCQVQVVACAEQFLRLPTGEDLFTTKLRVLDDGTEVAAFIPVPTGAVSSFTAGAVLPARRVPGEPSTIAVDWSSAGVAA